MNALLLKNNDIVLIMVRSKLGQKVGATTSWNITYFLQWHAQTISSLEKSAQHGNS